MDAIGFVSCIILTCIYCQHHIYILYEYIYDVFYYLIGARVGAVSSGTALQAISIPVDVIILPDALWPSVRLSL